MLELVSFLGTGLGRVIAAGGVTLVLAGGAYVKGRVDGGAKAEAACAAAHAAELGRQMAASNAAVEADKARAAAAEKAYAVSQQIIEGLSEDLRRRPPESVCVPGEEDAKKLLQIKIH